MMKTIDDLAVDGRRVLLRADLNVPLDGGRVADDGRIRASLLENLRFNAAETSKDDALPGLVALEQ